MVLAPPKQTFTVETTFGRHPFDDGAGFEPARIGYGTGLQGMADRLDAIGGSLEVRSQPGEGTTITGRIPMSASASRR